MKKSIALLAIALFTAFIFFGFTSCLHTEAQEQKKITVSMTSGQYQCQTLGTVEPCGVRLYNCTDGLRRFDVICGVNITIEKW